MINNRRHFLKEVIGISLLIMILGLVVRSIGAYSASTINNLIFANNRSIFDYFKIYFYAVTFLVLIEYFIVYDLPNNYLLSRVIGVLVMMLFTLLTYTLYYLIIGFEHNLLLIVTNYITSVFIGQYVSYLLQRRRAIKWSFVLGFANYFVIAISLLILTVITPKGFLFDWYL